MTVQSSLPLIGKIADKLFVPTKKQTKKKIPYVSWKKQNHIWKYVNVGGQATLRPKSNIFLLYGM